MSQPTLFSTTRWTVTELTRRVRARIDSDESLQDCWVEGEISNLSRPDSGHIYFSLKDAAASLRCVIWRTEARRLRVAPQDGMAVAAHGRVGVYEAGGQYQLYADELESAGEGALYQEFLRLKEELEAEGVFDPDRKRKVPEIPRRIGIVTSATGAALRDVINTLRRRMPLAEAVLAASPVQGLDAPPALMAALQALHRERVDVILLTRGGGSIEDLWAFNDAQLVRAVAASETPIICGVGHESDFTLCDFAADLRAATPTAAAELATAVTVDDLTEALTSARERLASAATNLLDVRNGALSSLASQLRLLSPSRRVQSERQRLDELSRRILSTVGQQIRLNALRIQGLSKRLDALNPVAVLERGYAIVTRTVDGSVISRVAQASGDMHVRVSDGDFHVRRA
jgi:exodeoxyribonuclease VII large subunit